MKKKEKVNLYVRGDIIVETSLEYHHIAKVIAHVPEACVDLSNAIIVDGTMKVHSLIAHPDARLAASGNIYFKTLKDIRP